MREYKSTQKYTKTSPYNPLDSFLQYINGILLQPELNSISQYQLK